jgi:hypothetical protein
MPPKQSLKANMLRGRMSCGSIANIEGPEKRENKKKRSLE